MEAGNELTNELKAQNDSWHEICFGNPLHFPIRHLLLLTDLEIRVIIWESYSNIPQFQIGVKVIKVLNAGHIIAEVSLLVELDKLGTTYSQFALAAQNQVLQFRQV